MAAGWKKPVILEIVGHRDFVVYADALYVDDDGTEYWIRKGQTTDLGSTWGIPLISLRFDGCFPMSCVLHDKNYREGCISRQDADNLLYNASYWEDIYYEERGKEGKGDSIRLEMYQGVRMFGSSSYKGKEEWNN